MSLLETRRLSVKKEQLLQQFREHQALQNAYHLALSTMYYDAYTIAPKDGAAYRNQLTALLYREAFKLSQDPTYIELVEQLNTFENDNPLQREIDLILRQHEKNKHVPPELMQKYSQLTNEANNVWEKARAEDDYAAFEPYLKNLLKTSAEIYQQRENITDLYDACLDDYEPGLTQATFDNFAIVIEEKLVPFIQQINALNLERPAFLDRFVSVEKQKKVMELIKEFLDFKDDYSHVSVSAHPFSSTFSINDTRITTAFYENHWTDAIFSLIHEIGHSTYSHQVNPAYEGRNLATNMSMGMHESQSRLLENNIGRSKAFWTTLFPKLKALVPEALHDVELDEFIYGINFPQPSLIRTQADELTYPLHILIRYRLEQQMVNEQLTDNLNEQWKAAYENLIGIRPNTDRQGILQDTHWSGGSFGYFPTYALGSAISCQLMATLEKNLNVEKELTEGNFKAIKTWLRENVHHYGALYDTKEWLLKITKEDFNPHYYIDYLIEKYTTLYFN